MEEVIFIDPNGNIIQDKEICSHIGLAKKLIDENEELKERYINDGSPKADLYLIVYEGYLSVSVDPIYGMNLTVNTEKISDTQREIVNNYLISGAKISVVDKETQDEILYGRHRK